MPKTNTNTLFVLVKSLNKAEKRHFRLYARRNFGDKNIKFLKLFDALAKQSQYDPDKIKTLFPKSTNSALSNLKAHLYEQLLISLRLLHRNESSLRVHELLSFASVLYTRGLYLQSLEQLKRARVFAETIGDDLSLHTIVEMERRVELFFVTESGENRARDIVETNLNSRKQLETRDYWANIALLLYDYYLKFGHVKNEHQFNKVAEIFNEKVEEAPDGEISIQGRIYKQMAYTWYYFISQNFVRCYRHAQNWVRLLESNEVVLKNEPVLYLKGIHNVQSALFYSNKPRQFAKAVDAFNAFIEKRSEHFDENTKLLSVVYSYLSQLNQFFLTGNFRGNEAFVEELTTWLETNRDYLDFNRIQVFHYKIACLYFGADDFKNCIVFLNKIIHADVKEKSLKQDVQCFARILNVVAHYELGNDDLVDYQLRSTYRFLSKYGDLHKVQECIIQFIRKAIVTHKDEITPLFVTLKTQLEEIFDDPYEQRPLLYLDLISWLKSRISGRSVEEIIRERQEQR
ncbi:MAG: hypothetical protein Crog4KO_34050 [Crocinitomicaceae bacterium]